jgi:hypothetical protein
MPNGPDGNEVSRKLDFIIKLLAGIMLDGKTLNEKISALKSLGFERKEIAALVGTTPPTVTAYLYAEKKKRKRKRGTDNAA